MQRIATTTMVALLLNVGAASIYAQQMPIKGSFSGNGTPTTIVLQQGALGTGEYQFDGDGTLGPFTFRAFTASAPAQAPIGSNCVNYGLVVAGGGVFRLRDGSLLMVNSAEGTDCITVLPTGRLGAYCTRTFKIVGGTGRLKNASGDKVTLSFTVLPVLFPSGVPFPVLSAITDGELTGTLSAVN